MAQKITTLDNKVDFLSQTELEEYYSLPKLDLEELSIVFELTPLELEYTVSINNLKSRIHFILMLGYFKSTAQLFDLKNHSPNHRDINYVCSKYTDFDIYEHKVSVSRPTYIGHCNQILRSTGWKQYKSSDHRNILKEWAVDFAKLDCKARFIFDELQQLLIKHQISIPNYSEFQIVISYAIKSEEKRLTLLIDSIPKEVDIQILSLFNKNLDNENINLNDAIYSPISMTNEQISLEVNKLKLLNSIYLFSKEFLKSSKLSSESIKYYASLVKYYGKSKLARMSNPLKKLYILCYVNKRFKQAHDNLVDTFHYKIGYYWNKAQEDAKEKLYDDQFLYNKNKSALGRILSSCLDKDKQDKNISSLHQDITSEMELETFIKAVDYMSNGDDYIKALKWQYISNSSNKFNNNIRLIFKNLKINYNNRSDLYEAAKFLRKYLDMIELVRAQISFDDIPVKFISKGFAQYIIKDKEIDFVAYEFLLYKCIDHALQAGDISIDDSLMYQLIDNDLSFDKLDNNILNKYEVFNKPIKDQLDNLEKELEKQILLTNDNIKNGINQAINIKSDSTRSWTLPYNKIKLDVNHSIYSNTPILSISDIFSIVERQTSFTSEFKHILDKNIKKGLDIDILKAVIIAKATNHGLYRMSTLSDYTYAQLKECSKSYLTLESVNRACDKISNAIGELPVFKKYNINNKLHAGYDGQKFATKYRLFKSRKSPKYFNLGTGVSSATLILNHTPINSLVFGANEHESRYLFDLVYNNETNIHPEIISTDSHGSNNVNFALLHFIDREFAPCYKRINNKESMLYGFKKPNGYKDLFIRPTSRINKQKIIDEWDNIKSIVSALLSKKINQHTLIRKLTSSTIKNTTKEALWEYNKILRSLYLYNYIDDEVLRQSVRKALNRTEAYHQLKKTVASINSEKLSGKYEECILLNDACTRLICLVIIYYNTLILSGVLEVKESQSNTKEVELIKKISLISWSHIKLHGNYIFDSDLASNFDINKIIEQAAEIELKEL